jgi:hypothetical protein
MECLGEKERYPLERASGVLMPQFSVHPDPKNAGYLLNVQTDILDKVSVS